ncbi:hypothetical protein MTO96_028514 [Rhipicephalus appendiculatus]
MYEQTVLTQEMKRHPYEKNVRTLPLITHAEHLKCAKMKLFLGFFFIFTGQFFSQSVHELSVEGNGLVNIYSSMVVSVKRGSIENDSTASMAAGHLVAAL